METVFKNGGVTIVCPTDTEQVEALIRVFEQIAAEQSWQPGNQLRAYPQTSHYFAVLVAGEWAGGMQVVLPDADGHLPCHAVWPESEVIAQGCTAHVTMLALCPQYRGRHGLFWPLCVEFWRWCVAEGVETVVLEATPLMLERYRRVGWPLEVIGDLRTHWGEECYLTGMKVREVAGSLLARALRSPIYRVLIEQAIRPVSRIRCASPSTLP